MQIYYDNDVLQYVYKSTTLKNFVHELEVLQ